MVGAFTSLRSWKNPNLNPLSQLWAGVCTPDFWKYAANEVFDGLGRRFLHHILIMFCRYLYVNKSCLNKRFAHLNYEPFYVPWILKIVIKWDLVWSKKTGFHQIFSYLRVTFSPMCYWIGSHLSPLRHLPSAISLT